MSATLPCPRCGGLLTAAANGAINTYECAQALGCSGTWCSQEAFNKLTKEALEELRNNPELHPRPVAAFPGEASEEVVPCPQCAAPMKRRHFRFEGRPTSIVLDHCDGHGIWFDKDELESVLRVVQLRSAPPLDPGKEGNTPERIKSRERHKRWLTEPPLRRYRGDDDGNWTGFDLEWPFIVLMMFLD